MTKPRTLTRDVEDYEFIPGPSRARYRQVLEERFGIKDFDLRKYDLQRDGEIARFRNRISPSEGQHTTIIGFESGIRNYRKVGGEEKRKIESKGGLVIQEKVYSGIRAVILVWQGKGK
jgi:hypothetical protein